MCGWPMLRYKHTGNNRRFRELAKRLELGAEYPIDTSEGARFRPDTPMVAYLLPLLHRLHDFQCNMAGCEIKDEAAKRDRTSIIWREFPEPKPDEKMIQLLWSICDLPPLMKATAKEWARKGLVPLIMARDAEEPEKCKQPALEAIWKQKGVKSRATFKSRLLTAVVNCLQGLARAA
jgi:hypothetical protein